MNTYFKIVCFLCFIIVFYACNCSKASQESSGNKHIEAFALSEYKADYIIEYNADGQYALVYKFFKSRPSDVFPTLNFKLLRTDSAELIFSDIVQKGSVKWVDLNIIEVKSEKGIPGPDGKLPEAKTYRYHVETRKKYEPGRFGNKG